MSTAPCPRCGRANGAHRVSCLYCGAAMPPPVAAPAAPPRKAVPANLDALVRDAMRGGGVGRLRAALEESEREALESTTAPVVTPGAGSAPARDAAPGSVPAPARDAGSPKLPGATANAPSMAPPSTITPRGPERGHPLQPAPSATPGLMPAPTTPTTPTPTTPTPTTPPARTPTPGPPTTSAPAQPSTPPRAAEPARSRSDLLDALVLAAERARVAIDLAAALDAVNLAVADARALLPPVGAAPAPPPTPPPERPTRAPPAPPRHEGTAAPPPPTRFAPAASPLDPPDLPEPPPPVTLPPVRFPWLLVVTAGGSAARLASALGVDHATAHQVAQAAGPRVVGRGEDRATLERRAARARAEGVHATVLARAALLELPAAETLLAWAPDGSGSACATPLWREPPDPSNRPAGAPLSLDGVFLVVPGEVEVRDQRAAREPDKWARSRYAVAGPVAERRVTVVDLHLPDRIVRVVEGIVDLRADPAWVAGSARRTLLAWLEAAPTRWPAARVEARRTCAGGPTAAGEDGRLSGSGWPTWEEYSRIARIHAPPPNVT